MPKRCAILAKKLQFGNKVSHANNKTRRRFEPNLHRLSIFSDALGQSIRLRLSNHALRSIEHQGGIDQILLKTKPEQLDSRARQVRRRLVKIYANSRSASGHG